METIVDPWCTVVPHVELDVDNIEVIRLLELAEKRFWIMFGVSLGMLVE